VRVSASRQRGLSVIGIVIIQALLLAGAVIGAPLAPASAGTIDSGVTSVAARDEAVVVTGSASAATEVEVYALSTEVDPDEWSSYDPVATVTASDDGSFTATLPRAPENTDLYYAKFLAVVDGEVVGTYRYVDDVEVTPLSTFSYPQALSKKGLQVQMTDDAEELGTQHAAINMQMDELMQVEDEGEENTITFVSNGQEFYFDRAAVEAKDRQIKPLSENGQLVNLILLVYKNSLPNSAASVLIHPDADLSAGTVFGFNTKTAEGVAYYTAAVEFLTQRYTRSDERYGRAVGFIVGNEVDAQWTWSNMGDKPLSEFLLYYERALRITSLAAKAAYSEARVYTSLTHCWTIVCGSNPDPENPTRYYEVRDVIDGLNDLAKGHGNYGWYLAHHPYPEDLFDPAFWNDTTATRDLSTTPRITLKNIDLLPQYLNREDLLFKGEPRRVILSEQGCNTPNATLRGERLQAACYALAYYKVRFLDSVDNFILHRHVDHQEEGGLRLGLWSWDKERPEPSSPGQHKAIYDVFKYIDTERSLEVTEPLLKVIGINSWSELVPGFDPDALAQRKIPTAVGASTEGRPFQSTPISTFDDGTDGWRVSDNASSVAASDGDLLVSFGALSKLWRGTDVEFATNIDATDRPILTTRLAVPEVAGVGARYAKMKVYSGANIAEGVARLEAGGAEQKISLDLSDWEGRSDISRIKVWIRGSTNGDWAGEFRIRDVSVSKGLAGTGGTTNVDVTASAPDGTRAGQPLQLTVTNNDLRPARAALRIVPCEGVSTDPATVPLRGLGIGESRTYDLQVGRWAPTDPAAPAICVAIQGRSFSVPVEVPAPTATSIFDFDDGSAQNWQPGENSESVSAVSSFLNAPGVPHSGTHALDVTAAGAAATAPKVVYVEPSAPLDLSDAEEVAVFVDSYGGVPDANGYEATFTLYSGDSKRTVTQMYSPDSWTEVVLDVGDWAGRTSVDRIKVGVRALGTDFANWSPHFQIDSLGYYERSRT